MTSRGLQRWWPRAKRQRWPRSRRFAPRSTARSATPPPDSVCSWQVLRRDLPALKLFLCHLHDYGPAFAFAALREPRGQAFGKALGRKSKTRFDLAFADRKRVVKVRGVGEIAHAELIEPIERALDAVSQAEPLKRPDEIPADVRLPPTQAEARRPRVRVMILVPILAPSGELEWAEPPNIHTGVAFLGVTQMREAVHEALHVQ